MNRPVVGLILAGLTGLLLRTAAAEESGGTDAAASGAEKKIDAGAKQADLPEQVTAALERFEYLKLVEDWGSDDTKPAEMCAQCEGKEKGKGKGKPRCFNLAQFAATDLISVDTGSRLLLAYCPDSAHTQLLTDAVKLLCVEYVAAGSAKEGGTSDAATKPTTEPLRLEPGTLDARGLAVAKKPGEYALQIDVRPNSCEAPSRSRRSVTVRRERYNLHLAPSVQLGAVIYGRTAIPSAKDQYLRPAVNVFFQDQSRRGDVIGWLVRRVGFSITFPEVNPKVTEPEYSLGFVACPINHYFCAGYSWTKNAKVTDNGWLYFTLSGVDLIEAVKGASGKK